MSQGNLEKMQKVREKSGNFKFPLKWYGYGSLLKVKINKILFLWLTDLKLISFFSINLV